MSAGTRIVTVPGKQRDRSRLAREAHDPNSYFATVNGARLSRRELLAAGALAGAALALERTVGRGPGRRGRGGSTSRALGPGDGWPGWTCPGVANLRRADGAGLLEAGSDVFPCDPRPVAFARRPALPRRRDRRGRRRRGRGRPGVVLRRDRPARLLRRDLRRRAGRAPHRAALARRRRPSWRGPRCRDRPRPAAPDVQAAERAHAPRRDGRRRRRREVQPTRRRRSSAPGDPGVLATARTLFPSEGPAVLPALGNLHLLPYGVQEGQAVIGDGGRGAAARRRSASARPRRSREIVVPRAGPAGADAAVGRRRDHRTPRAGALLRVAADVPAHASRSSSRATRGFRAQPPRPRRPDRRLRRGHRRGRGPAARPARLLARPAAARRARDGRPGPQLPRPPARGQRRAARRSRSARAPRSSARSSTSSPPGARTSSSGRATSTTPTRWARSPRPCRATPASGATSSPTRGWRRSSSRTPLRRPARRPRLRPAGREPDEPRPRGASRRGRR